MKNKQTRPIDWHTLSGSIPFRMTNDYLFRALLQTNNQVLIALVSSFLGWSPSEITSATIENPIELGKALDSKTFILDIHVMINSRINVNLEMQVLNESNWPDRSLVYLCRVFDSINRNEEYQDLHPAYHISIINFKLFSDHPEFYATYKLLNIKDFHEYTDKFRLSVLCLPYIDLATDKDRSACLDEWAAMFKATRWEELIMLAQKNSDIDNAVTTMYTISQDDLIQEQMRARDDYFILQRSMQRLINDKDQELDATKQALNVKNQELDATKQELESQKQAFQAEIAELKAKLAAAKI